MPGGDRSGPRGLGPMTGRGLGYCAGYPTPGYSRGPGWGHGMYSGWGRGWHRGRGRGYGRGSWYADPVYYSSLQAVPQYPLYNPPTKTDQLTMLKQEKEYLESEIEEINNAIVDIAHRIEELEKEEQS
jgi:hypothetical protein